MDRIDFSFSISELRRLFSKKTCPDCGCKNLKRYTNKKFKGYGKSTMKSMNLNPKIPTYEATLIYECSNCKQKYTLDGLDKGVALDEEKLYSGEDEESTLEDRKKIKNKTKIRVRKFFILVTIVMFLIAIQGSMASGNPYVLLVFAPIILTYYILTRLFTR